MAVLSNLPFEAQSVTVVTAGTVVSPSTAPYDNTNTIVVINTDASAVMYVAWDTSAPASLDASNATVIPPNYGSVTLEIGPLSARPQTNGMALYFDSDTNGAVANLTYVQGMSA